MQTELSQLYAIPAFRTYAIVTMLLVVKMIAVGLYTGLLRTRRQAFPAPEDYPVFGGAPRGTIDDDIERARRAHRNDLENILPFLAAALPFALTAPSLWAARLYFWGFLIARIMHTVAYLSGRQPHRTIAFAVGAILTLAMVVHTLIILL
jgi:uncharacterized MAPEG superfamily protein